MLGEVPVPGPDHGGLLPRLGVEFLESVHNLVQARMCMASKIIYWKCVDCNSMINDENVHDLDGEYAEFCYGCMNYNPEVVIAYA